MLDLKTAMAEPSLAKMDAKTTAFGNWFAGFVDGEGCFYINRSTRDTYTPGFKLQLREDDAAIIGTIRQTFGFGSIYYHSKRGKTNPSISYNVKSLPNCQAVIDLLDLHQLRSKKLRDYLVWREAVACAQQLGQLPRVSGQKYDWSRLIELKQALESGRKYQPPAEKCHFPVEPYRRVQGLFIRKISIDQFECIRDRVTKGETMAAIAREFGVLPGYISKIIHGHKWRKRSVVTL